MAVQFSHQWYFYRETNKYKVSLFMAKGKVDSPTTLSIDHNDDIEYIRTKQRTQTQMPCNTKRYCMI